MTLAIPQTKSGLERITERLQILEASHGFPCLADKAAFDGFIAGTGPALLLFAEDAAKVPESWDLTVILPELAVALGGGLRIGLLGPEAARSLAGRYDIRIWPALLVTRDGAYLGCIEGLKDWSVYARRLPELLAAEPSRPPGIGIPVRSAEPVATCH